MLYTVIDYIILHHAMHLCISQQVAGRRSIARLRLLLGHVRVDLRHPVAVQGAQELHIEQVIEAGLHGAPARGVDDPLQVLTTSSRNPGFRSQN